MSASRSKNHWMQLGGKHDLRVRLEFKAADFWVGGFVKSDKRLGATFWDLWICLLPMVPLHFAWDVEAPPHPDYTARQQGARQSEYKGNKNA